MSASSPASGREKRFTRGDEKGLGKRFWVPVLLILLLAAVTGYIYWLIPRSRPVVWYAALGVTNYIDMEGTPDLAYPQWSLEQLNNRLTGDCLYPWQWLGPGSDETEGSTTGFGSFAQIEVWRGDLLKTTGLAGKDTLVVYLRGHCLADLEDPLDPVWLLSSDFSIRGLEELRSGTKPGSAPNAEQSATPDGPPGQDPAETRAGMVSLTALLEDLGNLPAGNVVVLLDACDLHHLPGAGILANPVPAAVARCCKALEGRTKTPLWIITASASLQPTHVSDVRQRTLLQSAAEFACWSAKDQAAFEAQQDQKVTLAEFYEQLLRYAWTGTAGQQTPLLLKAGMEQPFSPGTGAREWDQAGDVVIAQLDRKAFKTRQRAEKDAASESRSAASTATDLREAVAGSPAGVRGRGVVSRSVHSRAGSSVMLGGTTSPWLFSQTDPISARQDPAASPTLSGGATGPAGQNPATDADPAPAAAAQNAAQNPVPPEGSPPTIAADPFWLACQQLASRAKGQTDGGFSPVDYAPHVWHELLDEVLRSQRLQRFGQPGSREPEAGLEQLLGLLDGIQRKARVVNINEQDQTPAVRIARGWNQLLLQLRGDSGEFEPWLRPGRLPTSRQDRWTTRRDLLRRGADGFAELSGWLAWGLSRPDDALEDATEIKQVVDLFADCFGSAGIIQKLAGDPAGNDSASPLDAEPLRKAEESLEKLRERLVKNQISRLEQQVAESQAKGWYERLPWTDERLLADLLDHRLTQPEQRAALLKLLDEIRAARATAITQKRSESTSALTSQPLAELLQNATGTSDHVDFLASRQTWCAAVERLIRLAGSPSFDSPASAQDMETKELNGWGRAVRLWLVEVEPGSGGTHASDGPAAWCRACWQGLFGVRPPVDCLAGMVPPFPEDSRLFLEFPADPPLFPETPSRQVRLSRDQLDEEWQLTIKRGDGRRRKKAMLFWTFADGPAPVVFKYNDQEVPADKPFEVADLEETDFGELAEFKIATTAATPGFRQCDISVQVAASAPGAEGESNKANLTVLAPNPDLIDLLVECLNPDDPGEKGKTIACKPASDGGTPVLSQPLEVPAVGEKATRSYRLWLKNQAATPRKVRVTIHAARGQPSPSGIGTGSDWDPDWQPAGTEDETPPASAIFVSAEPVVLPAAVAGEDGQSVKVVLQPAFDPPASHGFHGLLCVVEDVILQEPPGLPRPDPDGNKFRFWIRCAVTNPYGSLLLSIKPDPGRGSEGMRLDCSVSEDRGAPFGLENLPLVLEVRDVEGQPLGSVPGKLRKDLNPATAAGQPAGQALTCRLEFLRTAIVGQWKSPALGTVSVGEYQRAALFRSQLESGQPPVCPDETFARIGVPEPVPSADGLEELPEFNLKRQGPRGESGPWIIPNALDANAIRSPSRVSLDWLNFPLLLDCPHDSRPDIAIRLRNSENRDLRPEWRLATDREIRPSWKAGESGELLFSARADDLTFRVERPREEDFVTGTYRLSIVSLSGSREEELAAEEFLFDREAPDPPEIERVVLKELPFSDEGELYNDSTLRFAVQPVDAGSGVDKVWFAIGNSAEGIYPTGGSPDLDLKQPGAANADGSWTIDIKGDQLAQSKEGLGENLRVFTRCMDRAGNIRNECHPASFTWIDRPSPESKEGDGGGH